ncbi:hypothetical protein RhiirA4_477200 [Rhizophagus irregularis]|uniref:Uncharacterized protein n=1 Tax=Rhizophagus irregularis TaxID=588596 RepID=A0A2I1HCY6_9GLOM|nr:hypothetical protein RhiirA4_477200 [Rhizophagus irregularis]
MKVFRGCFLKIPLKRFMSSTVKSNIGFFTKILAIGIADGYAERAKSFNLSYCTSLSISNPTIWKDYSYGKIDIFLGKIKQKKWDNLPVYLTEKRKVLKTKELVQFALADLVVRGLVQEKIILRKTFEGSKGLSSSIVVIGVVPGAQANANIQTWYYFVK